MPSEKVLQVKANCTFAELVKLKKSACGVLVDYSGITVADDTVLRKELREAGVDYFVVKNTLLKRAAEMAGVEGDEDVLEGTTALALAEEDIVTAPKILYKQEEASNGSFSIKKGFVDGKGISKDEVICIRNSPQKHCLHSWYLCFSPYPEARYRSKAKSEKQSNSRIFCTDEIGGINLP